MESIGFRPRNAVPNRVTVPGLHLEFGVEGMTCAACAGKVTRAVHEVAGVTGCLPDIPKARVVVDVAGIHEDLREKIVRAITSAGYRVTGVPGSDPASAAGTLNASEAPSNPWTRSIQSGLFLTVIAGALMLVPATSMQGEHRHLPNTWWGMLLLASLAQVMVARQFHVGAWRQAWTGNFGMDALVSLGSGTAYVASVAGWILNWPGHGHLFESIAIPTFISLGHWLEARIQQSADFSLSNLGEELLGDVERIVGSGVEKVAVSALRPGDQIRLRAGEGIPVDGRIVDGSGSIVESMITGESIPVRKGPGERVLAGTHNVDGDLRMRVEMVGAETVRAGIARSVARAHSTRAGIQRWADRVASAFVPGVILTAALAAALWWWMPARMLEWQGWMAAWLGGGAMPPDRLSAAISVFCAVLVVACPCALSLATPAALMAGVAAAARRGILIRDAVSIEKAGRIDTVAFDKTGTLTTGNIQVTAIQLHPGNELGETVIRSLAAGLGGASRHPVSRAIASVSDQPASVREVKEVAGKGIQGIAEQGRLRLGALDWIGGGSHVPSGSSAGRVGLSLDGRVVAEFELADTLRKESPGVVRRLESDGLEIHLLSGDSKESAHRIAGLVGIAAFRVEGAISPSGKLEWIGQRQKAGRRIAFVGDGLNDGPALAQADLGIAVHEAGGMARAASDIVLLRSGIQGVSDALEIAQSTRKTIFQNLAWACLYNVVAIPLAVMGVLPPWACAIAMGLSDLVVVLNALRLSVSALRK